MQGRQARPEALDNYSALKHPHRTILGRAPSSDSPGCEIVMAEERSNPVKTSYTGIPKKTPFGFDERRSTRISTVDVRTTRQLVCGGAVASSEMVESHQAGTVRYLERGIREKPQGEKFAAITAMVVECAVGVNATLAGAGIGGRLVSAVDDRTNASEHAGEFAGTKLYWLYRKIVRPRNHQVDQKTFSTERAVGPDVKSEVKFNNDPDGSEN